MCKCIQSYDISIYLHIYYYGEGRRQHATKTTDIETACIVQSKMIVSLFSITTSLFSRQNPRVICGLDITRLPKRA